MTFYRTDDLTKWGMGISMRLSAAQGDLNNWGFHVRLNALEALPAPSAGIDDFSISGRNLYLHLTDSTILGPQVLPVVQYRSRGAWAATTSYSVLDTVTANGALYEVMVAHTSDTSFDAAANDGMGHDLYREIFSMPGNALPSGGAEGQMLVKSSGTSYAVTWSYRYPGSALAGMVPIAQSSTQDDVAWGFQQAENVEFTPSSDSGLTSDNVADAIEEAAGTVHDAADVPYSPSSDSGLISDNVADALDELGAAVGDVGGGGGGSTQGRHTLIIRARDMLPNTTNGPAFAAYEIGSNNTMVESLDFDSSTSERAQYGFKLPKAWQVEALLSFKITWFHPTTTTNFGVRWNISVDAYSIADGAPLDYTGGVFTSITSTSFGFENTPTEATTGTLAIQTPDTLAKDNWLNLRITRTPSHVDDTLAVDARLMSIELFYDTDADTDD